MDGSEHLVIWCLVCWFHDYDYVYYPGDDRRTAREVANSVHRVASLKCPWSPQFLVKAKEEEWTTQKEPPKKSSFEHFSN